MLHEVRRAVAWKSAGSAGLTPLVGREQEVALLRERWAQVKEGLGQVVLLSGEPALANRAWCRCCRNRWPRAPRYGYPVPVLALTTSRAPCIR